MTDEAEDAGPARVVPMAALQVVTAPGIVRVNHRSGRVVHTFTGPTLRADIQSLVEQLAAVVGDEKRMRREVLLAKPWWRFWK